MERQYWLMTWRAIDGTRCGAYASDLVVLHCAEVELKRLGSTDIKHHPLWLNADEASRIKASWEVMGLRA